MSIKPDGLSLGEFIGRLDRVNMRFVLPKNPLFVQRQLNMSSAKVTNLNLSKTRDCAPISNPLEYTDEEMEVFKSDPLKVKMVTETPDLQNGSTM
jgi:hypothetical protein